MKKYIAVNLLFLLIAGCSSSGSPTATVIPTVVVEATFASSLIPANPGLPSAATPEVVLDIPPTGELAAEWNGVPIMPGARTGEGDDESYVFIVRATAEQVQEYYQLKLTELGWQLLAQDAGGSSLMFADSVSAILTISIVTKGDEALVILAH